VIRWKPTAKGPFCEAKSGNSPDELEDSAIAVADGATESLLSGMWATTLVNGYSAARLSRPGILPWLQLGRPFVDESRTEQVAFLRTARESFEGQRIRHVEAREASSRPIQWYEERAMKAGSHAAFLGATFVAGLVTCIGNYHAWACGDVCLFQVRAQTLIRAWPVSDPKDFTNHPRLVATRTSAHDSTGPFTTICGGWRRGDVFIFASDAMAAWFLREWQLKRSPWDRVLEIEDDQSFGELVAVLRRRETIRNDDVALLTMVV
jgi:hypothetical protein